jgi:hypothetical protein
LAKEYELLNESENSERYNQNLLSAEDDALDPNKWFEYAKFCLKYNKP